MTCLGGLLVAGSRPNLELAVGLVIDEWEVNVSHVLHCLRGFFAGVDKSGTGSPTTNDAFVWLGSARKNVVRVRRLNGAYVGEMASIGSSVGRVALCEAADFLQWPLAFIHDVSVANHAKIDLHADTSNVLKA